MRILLTAAIAASLAAGSLSALAQTTAPAAPAKCKTLKDETSCTGRTDCTWTKPGNTKGKCKTAPKPKTA
jgi:hypothetical protein